MRSPRALWSSAFLCLAAFSCATYTWLSAIGYFDPALVALDAPKFAGADALIAVSLFLGSHLVRRPSRVRRLFRVESYDEAPYRAAPSARRVLVNGAYVERAITAGRHKGLALALAMSLCIALLGFVNLPVDVHRGAHRAHPFDWLLYFFAASISVVSHARLPRAREAR